MYLIIMTQKLELKIEGMTCDSCSRSITKRLSKFDFTSNINIDWEAGEGTLELDDPFDDHKETVTAAISQLGYTIS